MNYLRRSDDEFIGGICGGLAKFFDVDVTIIRFLFVMSVFFGGAGILIYLILWVVMPD